MTISPFCHGLLGVALCFGEQSQNVFFRFQAPVSLVLVFALVQLGVLGIWYAPWTYQRLTLLAVVLPVAVLPLSRGLSLATVPPRRRLHGHVCADVRGVRRG